MEKMFRAHRSCFLSRLAKQHLNLGENCHKSIRLRHEQRGMRELDWNTAAIDFYRALGATVLDDWRIVRVVGPALERLAEPR